MPTILPVHYQTASLTPAACGADPFDVLTLGSSPMIGTDDPHAITCGPCLTSEAMAHFTPITREEHAALVRHARHTLSELIEPLDDWLARQRHEAERRYLHLRALEDLYAETPRWALFTRRTLRRAIAGFMA